MGHRDLKNSSRPARASASRKQSGGGGVMMGVIIGLIVGVAAVVGVVMYFSKAGTPFTNLQKLERTASGTASSTPTQILSPGITLNDASSADGPVEAPPAQPARQQAASQPAPSAAAPSATTPAKPAASANGKDKSGQRFDFYKILPGQVEAVTADGNAPAGAHADNGIKKPYLQLGAFQNQDDADNLKAKLALIGVEATIQSADVPGKGIVHRVRVGPFATQADADRIRSLLKQNGIELGARPAN